MLQRNNRSTPPAVATTLPKVLGGTTIGIATTYLLFYATEIVALSHVVDLNLLSLLLLLGVPVVGIGYYETRQGR